MASTMASMRSWLNSASSSHACFARLASARASAIDVRSRSVGESVAIVVLGAWSLVLSPSLGAWRLVRVLGTFTMMFLVHLPRWTRDYGRGTDQEPGADQEPGTK